jgi:hypothetical protein
MKNLQGVRGRIVDTFEEVCIALVVIPTGIVALAGLLTLVSGAVSLGFTLLVSAVLTFLVTAFLAGGALTLVSIADNTREIVQMLQRMEKTELAPIAVDLHRLEGIERDARNQAAVRAAILPEDSTGSSRQT